MKTLSNILLMLSISAPLFADNITPPPPPPPPEKLAENTSTQAFPVIDQTFNSAVTNSNKHTAYRGRNGQYHTRIQSRNRRNYRHRPGRNIRRRAGHTQRPYRPARQ